VRLARPAGALALLALSGTSVAAYLRIFNGRAWLLPAVGAACLPILMIVGLRRAGLPREAAGAITLAAGAAYLFVVVRSGAGTGRVLAQPLTTRDALEAIVQAAAALDKTYTPADPSTGLVGILLGALVLAAVVSAAYLGQQGPPVAALPWIVVFVFAGAVGTPDHRLVLAVCFLVSLLALLYTEAWGRTAAVAQAAGVPDQPRGPPGLGAATATAAVVLALAMAAPSVATGILEGGPRIGNTTDNQTVLSPIVQILPRLNDPTPRVMFTVEAARPAYWRLTSLDRFDGDTWSASGEYLPVDTDVVIDDPPRGGVTSLAQRYTIQNLGGIWVPAAYAPSGVSGVEVSVDRVRGTIATDTLTRGQTYSVVSQVPKPTPDMLRRTGTRGAPSGSVTLPANLPPVIGQMASTIAGTAPTAYDQALAIQNFLRTFEYRQDIPPGHSGNYLVHFLTELRAGYCEQFAGSMAVMLRTLGIPARVAVGFLPGRAIAGGYVVGNEEAHAWVEVWFRGVGWVPFEPTPRSGVGPPSYATSPTTPPSASPGPVPATATPSPSPARPSPSPSSVASPTAPGAGTGGGGGPGLPDWARPALTAAGGIAAGLVLLMLARVVRLRAGMAFARSPLQRVFAAWQELLLRGADAWRPRRLAETEQEYARALVGALGVSYPATEPLVAARQRAAYGPGPTSREDADAAKTVIRRLRRELFRGARWGGRIRLLLSPRPLLQRRG
jgi:transglutaminase-like putative cysteine protease